MINILLDGNYLMHKTFGVFGGYGSKDPAEVLKTKGEQSMFIRKIATDLCASLKLLPIGGRLVFVTDGRSWRKDVEIEDGGYKSNRIKDESVDWTIFFKLLKEFGEQLEKMGYIFSHVDGAEGDDLLYFWSKYFNDKGEDCIIISGDKDMHQLARYNSGAWTIVWNANSKNNVVSCPHGWKEGWLEKKETPTIFDMASAMNPDKEKLKQLCFRATVEEVNPRDFVFIKMLVGDKGDAVPGIWEREMENGKMSKFTTKRAEQVMEALKSSKWSDSTFNEMLGDSEFLEWISGFSLRILKEIDNSENREKASSNLKRNYTLMWLDSSVIPEFVSSKAYEEIERGINLPRKAVTLDRIKILEGTEWVVNEAAPKTFDPFSNFF